jgi:hypothetical protein
MSLGKAADITTDEHKHVYSLNNQMGIKGMLSVAVGGGGGEVRTWWGASCRRPSSSTSWEDEGKEPALSTPLRSAGAGEGEGVSDNDWAASHLLRTASRPRRALGT